MKPTVRINFTDFWKEAKDLSKNPVYLRLSRAFNLELSDDPDFLIYSCFGHNYLKYDCIRIFYSGENVRPNFEECDYAFSSDYPVSERNFRMPLYYVYLNDARVAALSERRTTAPEAARVPGKFCNFLYSNPRARERIRFFDMLSSYRKVDSGGKVRNNLGHRVGDKMEFLKQYKFTIAFENSSWPGYTTEKIIQPFLAGSIPIYWGNPLIYRDFNTDAFINCHDFDSFEDVVERVQEIDSDEKLFRKFVTAPVFPAEGPFHGSLNDNIIERFDRIFSEGKRLRPENPLDRTRYYAFSLRKGVNWMRGHIMSRYNSIRYRAGE